MHQSIHFKYCLSFSGLWGRLELILICSGSETGYTLEWLSVHQTHKEEKHIHTYRQSKYMLHIVSLWVDCQLEHSHEEVAGDNAAELYTIIYQ